MCEFFVPSQEFQEHGSGQDRAERVGNSLPGDVWRGAVDRLEQRGAAGGDIAGGGNAESAGRLGGKIADDVAEEIVGDDDVELAGVADEFHGEGVDEEVAGIDFRVVGADKFEDALPEVGGKGHGVGFVAHAQAVEFAAAGELEGVADDALDAFAGVDVFLDGDFLGSSFLEEAANADVEAFGVFAEDHEVDVFAGAVAERRKAVVEKLGGAGIDV